MLMFCRQYLPGLMACSADIYCHKPKYWTNQTFHLMMALDLKFLSAYFSCSIFHSNTPNSCQDISFRTRNVNLLVALKEKSGNHHQVIRMYLLGTTNVFTKCNGHSTNSCWDISEINKNDWQTLLTGFMGVRPEPVWSLWRSSKRPGDLSLRTSIILPGERSIRGSAMALPGERSNRGSAMALPGDPTIRLSSILPGDFSLSSGRLGDLSRRNSVRASR